MKLNYDELNSFTEEDLKGDTSEIDEILEYEEILYEISRSIKEYRNKNKMTQKQLAKKLDIDQVMISKLESGNYNPTFKQIHKISRKLTDSANLFIKVLDNIIKDLNEMYTTTYEMTIIKNDYKITYIDKKRINNTYKYEYDYKGEKYGKEKCTSTVSVAW